MKTVCVIGHFGGDQSFCEGQTVKTKVLTQALRDALGQDQVDTVDTYGGMKVLLRCVIRSMAALKHSKNVVILPAQNGVQVFAPLLVAGNLIFRRKLHYAVVGGWLPEFLKNKPVLRWVLKKFHGIYVETNHMKKAMEAMGFKNITIMPNCKDVRILTPEELIYPTQKPFRLCTFSRVTKPKGIEDAVNAVKAINEKRGERVYTLDIYGQIDPNETGWFEDLQQTFPEYITYKGMAPFDQSVEILKDYFALLFPTFYHGEGFAGTLIDAMASGIPTIASDFRFNSEIVLEGITGRLHPTTDVPAMVKILEEACDNTDLWNAMKCNCIENAKKYTISNVACILIEQL